MALCNDWEVAKTTLGMPHPYPPEHFLNWVPRHAEWFANDIEYNLAITEKDTGAVVGSISISGIHKKHLLGEIGYWVGRAYWNRGYTTEAARALTDYVFREKGLHKLIGRHFACNPASGRVMEKLGMEKEGVQKRQYFRNGQWQDVVLYGLVRPEQEGDLTLRVVDAADPVTLALFARLDDFMQAFLGEDSGLYTPYGFHEKLQRVWALFSGRTPIGCVAYREKEPGVGELKRLYLVPEFRGRGLSKRLIQSVEAFARSKDDRTLLLETRSTLEPAFSLYQAAGYAVTFRQGLSVQMEKQLGE